MPNTPAAKDLPPKELEKRMASFDERKKKLKDPNFAVSKTRLSLRNLALSVDEKQLKQMAIDAIKKRKENSQLEIVLDGFKKKVAIQQVTLFYRCSF